MRRVRRNLKCERGMKRFSKVANYLPLLFALIGFPIGIAGVQYLAEWLPNFVRFGPTVAGMMALIAGVIWVDDPLVLSSRGRQN